MKAKYTSHAGLNMRDEVKRVAIELLLQNGYQGLRFRDIADRLGTSRANIHHHFGNKLNLCEEVITEYVARTLESWEANWCGPKTLNAKIEGMMEANRARYLAFNPTGQTAHPWSLIGRMRLERETISPHAQQALVEFGITLDRLVLAGVSQAIEKGELVPDAPREAISLQLVAVADSAGFITQDGGDFRRLEQLYRSISSIVQEAYGPQNR
jgi:AcrR family transcriptional regulator